LTQEKLEASFKQLPLSAADDSTLFDIPYVNDWLAHETYDKYWENVNFRGIAKAPVISLAGWYDIFLNTQIKDFQALVQSGDSVSRLIVGPWAHGPLGEPNEYGGTKKTGNPRKIFKYVKKQLKGKRNRLTSPLENSRYNLFIMERNEYIGSELWPPPETRVIPYFIGRGEYLGPEMPGGEGFLEFDYNPSDPFPSHGGTALGEGVGPARQNANVGRRDQLVFKKEPQVEPMILLGPISATLWLSSDAPCTHCFVELQDVFPDGKIINIQEGIARVNVCDDQPRRTEISVWATGYQLNPGHSLRVVISSSWFPRYNRSLNTCDPIYSASELRNARQRVFFGGKTPSSINLPVYFIDGND
jgi:putative CocE/NonD family hydrolase